MNSKNAKINLNVTACPVFSAARPARAKCGPKPDRSKLKLQFSSQFSSIPLILSFCLPLCGCYLLGVPSSPLLLSFPPVLSSLPPSLSPSYYTLTPLPFLPLSFASYSLPLPSSLLFLRLFCSYSSASASASFLCHHLFCFHQHSSRPLQLNSATNSPPPPPPPLSDANLPRSLGDRHFLLPLRYQLYCALLPPPVPSAPFMLLRPSQHSCLYPGVNWSF
ncbi:hypothetical protein ASPTUDRAFT_273413 [Aspergillus tubingensis CBS 134.48]|uniref:Uncharacterized protein n=1 Tax=Aspergillus tubingensis (strain CBS 134.48) TaxID=767770 RepID=A0A1L9NNJ9_ASPTC|nr:hypothetical protein ASPTUDRAFT_273413 [Aspergillus tubingensis CBS 134.48]